MMRLLPVLLLVLIVGGLFASLPFRREVLYKLHLSGDPTASCCNVTDVLSQSGAFNENASLAFFDGAEVDYPKTSLAQALTSSTDTNVLGTTNGAGEEKWIEVDLATQTVRAWEGNRKVMEFLISSGRWAATPKGTFNIWYKTRYQSMVGGSQALGTYYNLPNVPHNMFFFQGFALHGAYWHNNFGHPMSHGCVNEPLANAQQIFDWAGPNLSSGQNAIRASAENPGTRVYIH